MKDILQTELIMLFLIMCFFRKLYLPEKKKERKAGGEQICFNKTHVKSCPDGGWVTAVAGHASDKDFLLGHLDFS